MSITVPQVLDPFIRTVRTGLQVAVGFVSIAPVIPLVVEAIHADDGSQTGIVLAATAAWVTTVAGAAARVMAIPAVNTFLGKLGLAGHSGIYLGGGDTMTQYVPVQAPATDPLH